MASSLSTRTMKKINVVFLGDSSVGKSSIINRILGKEFNPNMISTVGVENSQHTINVNGKKVVLTLHDTAGQESMKSMTKSFYRECYVAVFVFSGDQPKSLSTAQNFARPFKLNYTNTKEDESFSPLCVCVRNKTDLESLITQESIDDAVSSFSELYPEFQAYKNMKLFETSCINGSGINELVTFIGEQLDQKHVFDNLANDKQTIKLKKSVSEDVQHKEKRSTCC